MTPCGWQHQDEDSNASFEKLTLREGFGVNGLFSTSMEKHTNIFAASLLHWVIYEKSQGLPEKQN